MDLWEYLADEVRTEASRRYRTTREFAEASGLSESTIESIYAATHTRHWPSTIAKLQKALGWSEDSYDRIFTGLPPRYAEDPDRDRLIEAWRVLSRRDRKILLDTAVKMARERG